MATNRDRVDAEQVDVYDDPLEALGIVHKGLPNLAGILADLVEQVVTMQGRILDLETGLENQEAATEDLESLEDRVRSLEYDVQQIEYREAQRGD